MTSEGDTEEPQQYCPSRPLLLGQAELSCAVQTVRASTWEVAFPVLAIALLALHHRIVCNSRLGGVEVNSGRSIQLRHHFGSWQSECSCIKGASRLNFLSIYPPAFVSST